jgi:hypothetical protein
MKRSTNNAFTGATNSIDWKPSPSSNGGIVTAAKNGTPVYLPNSKQVRAYSAAGAPK